MIDPSFSETQNVDIIIVGGGNAGLCAAITAARSGASVIVLEVGEIAMRGGNSRHTRNFRCMHKGPLSVLTDTYSVEEYFDDLLRVTAGNTDEELAKKVIKETEGCLPWLEEQGVRFQPSLSGTLSLSRTNAFFLGGGKALVNALYNTAEDLGVEFFYGANVRHVDIQSGDEGNHIEKLEVETTAGLQQMRASAYVLSSGGFQSDLDWLANAWGPAARNFLIRGTPNNKGVVLRNMIEQGAESVGDPTQCHAVAIDGRAPKFDGGIVTRLDCVPYSVVLNQDSERFYDEGEDLWPKRYAIWGRLVASQPEQVAYAIIDSRSAELFMPSVFPPEKSDTIEGLAACFGLDEKKTAKAIDEFNRACADGEFIPTELDGLSTTGLTPPKTNWARPIIEPPFYGYSLRPGVTFTYLGLRVDKHAQVQMKDGPLRNCWAAGEIMAGSVLGEGYLAGFGMAIGTVFGRTAGQEAANYVH